MDINVNQVRLSQLRALLAVARYGNFGEAAFHLNVTQSAISHAIATLEKELGVSLLMRGRLGASLTPVGEKMITHIQQIQQSLEMIEKEAYLARGLQGGQVRIASFRSVATHILPDVIAEFSARHPEIPVIIRERSSYVDVEQSLRDGQVDIGITYLPTSDDLEAIELFRDEYVVLLPPQSKIKGNHLTWKDLATFSLVILPCLPCGLALHHHLKNHAPPMPTDYSIQEDSTVVRMVYKGLGAAILARLAAEPIPKEVKIYSLPIPFQRVIGAAILADGLHTPSVFAFLDILKKFSLATSSQTLLPSINHVI